MTENVHPAPLPEARKQDGQPRRLGIELEFSGLTEKRVAEIVADVAPAGRFWQDGETWRVRTPAFGECEAYLDTRFRKDVEEIAGTGVVDFARLVIPVELVTEPFDPFDLPLFDEIVAALRAAGAVGSRQGLFLGFGVHLNVEAADLGAVHLWRRVTAYALIEAELRGSVEIDLSRRVLPFVQPYPDALIDDLAAGEPVSIEQLIDTYLAHAPTRNHGLDMLPIFAQLDPERLEGRVTDGTATKPRPAYHFRMPDCRIDEDGWSIFEPWSMWLAVERLAEAPELFDRIRRARLDWAGRPRLTRGRWRAEVARMLDDGPAEATQ